MRHTARGDAYSYGRTREPAVTLAVDAAEPLAYVCASCGCSAASDDATLLAAIGWKALPPRSDTARLPAGVEVPALCPRCTRKHSHAL